MRRAICSIISLLSAGAASSSSPPPPQSSRAGCWASPAAASAGRPGDRARPRTCEVQAVGVDLAALIKYSRCVVLTSLAPPSSLSSLLSIGDRATPRLASLLLDPEWLRRPVNIFIVDSCHHLEGVLLTILQQRLAALSASAAFAASGGGGCGTAFASMEGGSCGATFSAMEGGSCGGSAASSGSKAATPGVSSHPKSSAAPPSVRKLLPGVAAPCAGVGGVRIELVEVEVGAGAS